MFMKYLQSFIACSLLLVAVSCGSIDSDNLQSAVTPKKETPPVRQQKSDMLTVYFSSKTAMEKGQDCAAVIPVAEQVIDTATPQRALTKLLQGPAESQKDVSSFFSSKTAGLLKSVKSTGDTIYVDFKDMRKIIPNASTSCGSSALLAQLDTTLKNFPAVKKTIYAIEGNPRTFYEWIQVGCTKDNNDCDATPFKPATNQNSNKKGGLCIDKCGDNKCQEVVCTGSGCPCPESAKSCAVDCKTAVK